MHLRARERRRTGSKLARSFFSADQGCSSFVCSPVLCIISTVRRLRALRHTTCSSDELLGSSIGNRVEKLAPPEVCKRNRWWWRPPGWRLQSQHVFCALDLQRSDFSDSWCLPPR